MLTYTWFMSEYVVVAGGGHPAEVPRVSAVANLTTDRFRGMSVLMLLAEAPRATLAPLDNQAGAEDGFCAPPAPRFAFFTA